MNSEDFFRIILTKVDKTVGQIFLMVLKFSICNSLSVTQMTNAFKLVNSIFEEPILPDSRYAMDKLLNTTDDTHFYAVCHNCSSYIGKFEEVENVKSCGNCNIDLDLSNPSNASYFVILDPSVQVADLLNTHSTYYNNIVNNWQCKEYSRYLRW